MTQIKIAHTSDQELDALENFYNQVVEMYQKHNDLEDIAEYVIDNLIEGNQFSIGRITLGYKTMSQAAFDQGASHIKFNQRFERILAQEQVREKMAISTLETVDNTLTTPSHPHQTQ